MLVIDSLRQWTDIVRRQAPSRFSLDGVRRLGRTATARAGGPARALFAASVLFGFFLAAGPRLAPATWPRLYLLAVVLLMACAASAWTDSVRRAPGWWPFAALALLAGLGRQAIGVWPHEFIAFWAAMVLGAGYLGYEQLFPFASYHGWRHFRQRLQEAPADFEAVGDAPYTVGNCGLPMQRPARFAVDGDAWHLFHRLEQVKNFSKPKSDVTGEAGETRLYEEIGQHKAFRGFVSFADKRVPILVRSTGGEGFWQRREIDLLILTHSRIYNFEVKNWNGAFITLAPQTGNGRPRWASYRLHRKTNRYDPATLRDEEDLVAWNQQKCEALADFLSGFGLKIDPGRIVNKVVFMGNAVLDERIARQPEVIAPDTLRAALDRHPGTNFGARFCRALLDLCEADRSAELMRRWHDEFDLTTRDRITWVIDHALGTWDRIHLRGGRVVKGDLISIAPGLDEAPWLTVKLGENRFRKVAHLHLDGERDMALSKMVSLELSWVRHPTAGRLFARLNGLNAPLARRLLRLGALSINGHDVGPLTGYEVVKIRTVGKEEPELIPLILIDRIELG